MQVKNQYIGNELELFQHAVKWKRYFSSAFHPFIGGDVLEVGAGIGGTTKTLCKGTEISWTCLEPDATLADKIKDTIQAGILPSICRVVEGTTSDLPHQKSYDTVLYIDVIEHIEKDKEELAAAVKLIKSGGYLIILVPAFQYFFSPFDEAIGHFRRYDKKMLQAAIPDEMNRVVFKYMDSIGLAASFVNKLFLKQSHPTIQQVKFWDTYLVSLSKVFDKMVFHSFGKSLIGVWKK